jgi:GTP cyclohydrolase IA
VATDDRFRLDEAAIRDALASQPMGVLDAYRDQMNAAERRIYDMRVTHPETHDPRVMALAMHITDMIGVLGYDQDDQHFFRSPVRVAKWLLEYASNGDPEKVEELLGVEFDDEHDSMVIVGPTRVNSMCAHHWLPVTGWAWVGYIPDGKVVGLSKLARVVHYFAKQFTLQERVTQEVANALQQHLNPLGVMVVIEAEHGCMSIRGVEEPCAVTVTSAVRGVFKNEPDARAEFMALRGTPRTP